MEYPTSVSPCSTKKKVSEKEEKTSFSKYRVCVQETRAGERMRGDDKLTLRRHRSVHHPSLYIPAALQQPISNLLAVSCLPPSPFPPFDPVINLRSSGQERVSPSSTLTSRHRCGGGDRCGRRRRRYRLLSSLLFGATRRPTPSPTLANASTLDPSLSLSLFAKRETNPPSLPGGSLPFSPPPLRSFEGSQCI